MNPLVTKSEKEYILIMPPESLMNNYCDFNGPGETVGDLTDAYVHNTNCGRKFKTQLLEQKEWVNNVKPK